MHPYLTRLGIMPEVQAFFRPFYFSDDAGNLCFPYGKEDEQYGFAFHRVPITDDLWLAGNLHTSQVRLAIVSASALDAAAWLNKKYFSFADFGGLLFVSFGAGVSEAHIKWLSENLKGAQLRMIFAKDLLGRCADLKVAAAIRSLPLSIYVAQAEQIIVVFRSRKFIFSQEAITLNAFEKAARFRFGISATKPRSHNTFFDELRAGAGL
jgi:hypothetical protein